MKKILLVGMARETSTRCPQKMIKQFADTTLFDIYFEKIKQATELKNPFTEAIMAINKNDRILWKSAVKKEGIKIQERKDSSIAPDSVLSSNFSFLEEYDEEYVMWVNGCFPFIRPETIIAVAGLFFYNKDIKSLHCVKKRTNWFWGEKGNPLTIRDRRLSRIQDAIPIYESVHCFHIFNRRYLLENCAYWDFTDNNPFLCEVEDDIEFLDIDTDMDFKICEMLYKKEVKKK